MSYVVGEFWAWARKRRRRFRVHGPSMEPTLPGHSYVLIEVWPPRDPPRKPLGVGDVVVVNHPSKPIMIIKRVSEISSEGLLDVRSDNRADGTDSRHFGRIDPARVVGRATLSLDWPLRRL